MFGAADSKLEILLLAKDMSDRAFASFQGHVTRADKSVSKLSGTMKVMSATAVTAIGATAVASLDRFIDRATDMNETLSKSSTLFGSDVAQRIASWGDTTAYSIGLSKQASVEATATMGNMFVQLGAGSERAASLSTSMIKLSGDLASYHNVVGGAVEVSDAMQSAFRGEYDALQRYIPTINAAAVKAQALADTHKKNADELTDLEKAIAAVEIITRDAGAATDDFSRTSDGLANQQRIMKAQLSDLSAEIGESFIPMATNAVHWTNEWIKSNKDWISSTAKFSADFLDEFSEFADKQFNIARAYREYAAAWKDFVDAASGELPRLRGAQVPDDIYGMDSGKLNAQIDSALAKEFNYLDSQQHKIFQDMTKEDAKAVKELERQIAEADKAIAQSNANPWDPIGYDIDSGGIDEVAAAIQRLQIERNNRALETARKIAAQQGIEDTYDIDQGDPMAGYVDAAEKAAEEMKQAFVGWGNTVSATLADSIIESEFAFDEIAKSFERMLLQMAIQKKIVEPIFSNIFKEHANGGVYNSPSLASYEGMVTNKPHFFGYARGGVFGEAGWEAIMPLAKTPSGKLGVEAVGGGIVVNHKVINNAGVQVKTEERKTSQGVDLITTLDTLQAGNVSRRGSATARALRNTYGAREQLVAR